MQLLKLSARWSLLILIIVALLTVAAIVWGQFVRQIPAVVVSSYSPNGISTDLYIDPITMVSLKAERETLSNRTFNGFDYRIETVEDITSIYLTEDAQAERFIAEIATNTRAIDVIWRYDLAYPLYLSALIRDDEASYLTLYAVDMTSGEVTQVGDFPFSDDVNFIYAIDESRLILNGAKQILVVNTQTGAYFYEDDAVYFVGVSSDAQFGAYPKDIIDQERNIPIRTLMLLDFATLEAEPIPLPNSDAGVMNVRFWSPEANLLPIADDDDHVYIFNADTRTFIPLPEAYLPQMISMPWLYENNDLIMIKQIAEEQIEYVIYNLDTGDETPLFRSTISRFGPTYSEIHEFSYAYQQPLILAHQHNTAEFAIYNARTGAAIAVREFDRPYYSPNLYLHWYYHP